MNDGISQENSSNHSYDSSWIKPDDVMKSRKLKSKRHALKARLSASSPIHAKINCSKRITESIPQQKRNPFKCLIPKSVSDNDNSNDTSLFQLFNKSQPLAEPSLPKQDFSNLFSNDSNPVDAKEDEAVEKWSNLLYVDWSLKSRIRFSSSKPFHWKHTFKTSEEASGTTGFVRCLNPDSEEKESRTLDTSTNAQFYQCCLVWQHPSLPVANLFPRYKQKISSQTGVYGLDQNVSNTLHREWAESLRSLYQLLRVRQCPYFYICSHTFTCLFRAAGASGFPHTHAVITPTARGFREAMKKEGVEFTMPFKDRNSFEEEQLPEETKDDCDAVLGETESDEPTEFLETLGLETSQFPTLSQGRTKRESSMFRNIDGLPQSLVFVEDMELHGLVNFLLNCASCISTTGSMAGIPPTLLSPVAFHGGTLKSLKISGGSFRTPKGETNYSTDIQGPILPTSVLSLCYLLSSSHDNYSASLYPLTSTIPFSSISPSLIGSSMPMAFAFEGLVDCGLGEEIRKLLCKSSEDVKELTLPETYRAIQFKEGKFTWRDKL